MMIKISPCNEKKHGSLGFFFTYNNETINSLQKLFKDYERSKYVDFIFKKKEKKKYVKPIKKIEKITKNILIKNRKENNIKENKIRIIFKENSQKETLNIISSFTKVKCCDFAKIEGAFFGERISVKDFENGKEEEKSEISYINKESQIYFQRDFNNEKLIKQLIINKNKKNIITDTENDDSPLYGDIHDFQNFPGIV